MSDKLSSVAVGRIFYIKDNIISVSGLRGAFSGELVFFRDNNRAISGGICAIEHDVCHVPLLRGDPKSLKIGDAVYRSYDQCCFSFGDVFIRCRAWWHCCFASYLPLGMCLSSVTCSFLITSLVAGIEHMQMVKLLAEEVNNNALSHGMLDSLNMYMQLGHVVCTIKSDNIDIIEEVQLIVKLGIYAARSKNMEHVAMCLELLNQLNSLASAKLTDVYFLNLYSLHYANLKYVMLWLESVRDAHDKLADLVANYLLTTKTNIVSTMDSDRDYVMKELQLVNDLGYMAAGSRNSKQVDIFIDLYGKIANLIDARHDILHDKEFLAKYYDDILMLSETFATLLRVQNEIDAFVFSFNIYFLGQIQSSVKSNLSFVYSECDFLCRYTPYVNNNYTGDSRTMFEHSIQEMIALLYSTEISTKAEAAGERATLLTWRKALREASKIFAYGSKRS